MAWVNTYLTSGDRPFETNTGVDPRQVGISQLDAALLFGATLNNLNGFYSLNAFELDGRRDRRHTEPGSLHS
jgi:hypothetical protein